MTVVQVENGPGRGRLLIEVDRKLNAESVEPSEIYGAELREGLTEKVVKLSRPLFAEALDLVDSCAGAVVERLDQMTSLPNEVEMQLAIQMDTKVGAKIVELSGGAQLQVTMRWTGLGA